MRDIQTSLGSWDLAVGLSLPTDTDSDTLCRTMALRWGFHAHRRTLHRTRECSETRPPCQDHLRRTPVKAHDARDPERLWLGRPNALRHQVGHSRGTSRSTMRGWNTWFTTRLAPPCQGDGFWLAATSKAGTSKPVQTLEEDASLQSLQSTYCQRSPKDRLALELGAFTLPPFATSIEPRPRHACTGRDTSRPRRRWLAVAGMTSLEWWTGLAPVSPAVTWAASDPEGSCLEPRQDSHGRFQPCTSRDGQTTDVPRPSLNRSGCPEAAQRARALSACVAPNTAASQTRERLLPIDPGDPAPRWRLERDRQATSVTRA